MKHSAAQFSALCSQVSDCARSLASCLPSEVESEGRHLRSALNDLCAAEVARDNSRLIEMRRSAIAHGNEVLARRNV